MNSKINAKYKCYFQEIWPDDPKFSSWSRKDESETQAFCLLCLQSSSVESHGKTSLTLHASGEKHKSRIRSNTKSTLVTFVPARKAKDNKTDEQKKVNRVLPAQSKIILQVKHWLLKKSYGCLPTSII